jgi:rSAM/selenodomain-associated transferase 1
MFADLALAVFARAPVAGECKTRLIPLLGNDGAARLQADLITRALATVSEVAAREITLWLDGDPASVTLTIAPVLARAAVSLQVALQRGADLGERMQYAFATTLARHARCVLIGTDCPELTPDDVRRAAAALNHNDVVLQPAFDGGYVLIGLRAPQPGLFAGVTWGEATVMAQTQQRIASAGLRAEVLPPRSDLDTPEDYRRLLASGLIAA